MSSKPLFASKNVKNMFSIYSKWSPREPTEYSNIFKFNTFSGNFRQSSNDLRGKYLERTARVQEQVKYLLDTSNRDVWKCDPDVWSIGTYEEVTRLLQGYIDNEVNLNAENNCKSTCTDYKQTRHHVCQNGTYCSLPDAGAERAICKGTIVDCDFFGSDMNICESVSVNACSIITLITI